MLLKLQSLRYHFVLVVEFFTRFVGAIFANNPPNGTWEAEFGIASVLDDESSNKPHRKESVP